MHLILHVWNFEKMHFEKKILYTKKIAEELYKIIRKYCYYLNSQLVCPWLADLADTDMSVTDQLELLCTLLSFEVPNDKDFYKTKPELPDSAILYTAINL